MKRKNKSKKAIALLCSMSFILASCGSGGEAPAASSEAPVDNTGGMKKISLMAPSMHGTELKNEGSDKVIQMYEDYTGTEVDWRFENDGTYAETFGLTLMDKDNMPMILTGKKDLTANVVDAAKKGAFWDLTEYLKDTEKFPNLSKANPNVLNALTVDGQIIGVYRARAIGRLGVSYRTDWAEAVGITSEPKTIEDMYDMMYKFTYEDPDGNGKDDTYGLELTKYTGPFDVMQTWFGVGNKWVEEDGKLIPVHQTKEYREALKMFNKMYEEGLVRKDWATVDSGTFSESVKKGESGVYIDVMDSGKRIWQYFESNDVKSVTNPEKLASMTLLGGVNDKTLATSGFNGYFLITKAGAKTEEDLINCLTFLDKLCDDEMLILGEWGMKDDGYELNEKGEAVLTSKYEAGKAPQQGFNQAFAYIPNRIPVSVPLAMDEPTKQTEIAYAENEKIAVFNPALGYLANSSVNAEVGTDIEQIIDDARTQYICGQLDDAGFDKAAQQWLDRGGDRLIEEINALHSQSK